MPTTKRLLVLWAIALQKTEGMNRKLQIVEVEVASLPNTEVYPRETEVICPKEVFESTSYALAMFD